MRKIWFVLLAALPLLAGAAAPGAAFGAPAHPAASSNPLAIKKSDRILGKPNAPVTIIEYASLSCPHCGAFANEMLPTIEKDWIDSGKARLILRDFPLDKAALEAAMIARCAPPNRFYDFVHAFFASQPQWVLSRDPRAALIRMAKLGGMDTKTVDQCLANKTLEKEVLESRLVAAKQLGVDATPTFFINGKKFTGEPPDAAAFEKLLQNAASHAKKG